MDQNNRRLIYLLERVRNLSGKAIAVIVGLVLLVGAGAGIAVATTTSTSLAYNDLITYDRSYADGTNGSALDMMEWRFDRNNDGTPDRIAYINEKGEYRGVSNGNTVMFRIRENTSVTQSADEFQITDSTGATVRFAINKYGMPIAPSYTSAGLPTTGLVAGAQAWDTTTSKPVFWSGSAWLYADGSAV